LVGGCDVKTREISFIHLMQLGLFESWRQHGRGCIPGEGAAFLVLESEEHARQRGKRAYARIADYALRSTPGDSAMKDTLSSVISGLRTSANPVVVAARDDGPGISDAEERALTQAGLVPRHWLRPKRHLGNLFAAAATVQVALAAALCGGEVGRQKVLADCFGYGSEQASFVLEEACVAS
jgi:3-oxoacyl-(acyl-carrier-protein) synthase